MISRRHRAPASLAPVFTYLLDYRYQNWLPDFRSRLQIRGLNAREF